MRAPVPRLVRDVAYRLAVATRLPAYRRRRGAAIFAFHNVVADDGVPEQCDRSLHIPVSAFQDYIGIIEDGHTLVPLLEIADRIQRRRSIDGLGALTFDDAYRGVIRHAAPFLARRGLPATLFVVSGAAAAPAPFWWDVMSENGGVPPGVRHEVLMDLEGDGERILSRNAANDTGMPDDLLPSGWTDIRAMARKGFSIGSHTAGHRNLARLDVGATSGELDRSRADIAAALGAAPVEIAYPYGLHDDRVLAAARRAGYTAGVTLRFSRVTRHDDPLALPRITVPAGLGIPTLQCWAAGLRLRTGA